MPSFTGSCTCGAIRFVVSLELPPPAWSESKPDDLIRPLEMYKCNCTWCHKMGFFHLRVSDPSQDFYLLSPLNPVAELGDYNVRKHWFFCKDCGCHPFIMYGEGEVIDVDFCSMGPHVAHLGVKKAWKVKTWKYFSVNAQLVDAHQDGFDLREWTEKKWIRYINALDRPYTVRHEHPQPGGQY